MGKEEPLWSKNLKKGVLSTFQLDLVTGRQNDPHVEEYTTREVRKQKMCGVCVL